MGAKVGILAVAAAVLLSACSREGFEESLKNRADKPQEGASQAQSQPQEDLSHEDFIFDLDTMEYEEEGAVYLYALPLAVDERAEAAAENISQQIDDIIVSLPAEVADGRECDDFAVYDAITCNDGRIFSVMYEIYATFGDTEEEYRIGLVFDPVTGDRMELDDVMDVDTLVTLISDEQASHISGRDEELVAKKRDYIRGHGEEELRSRLTAKGGLDVLLDASCYIDGSDLVAVFSAVEEIGGPVEVSIGL